MLSDFKTNFLPLERHLVSVTREAVPVAIMIYDHQPSKQTDQRPAHDLAVAVIIIIILIAAAGKCNKIGANNLCSHKSATVVWFLFT